MEEFTNYSNIIIIIICVYYNARTKKDLLSIFFPFSKVEYYRKVLQHKKKTLERIQHVYNTGNPCLINVLSTS